MHFFWLLSLFLFFSFTYLVTLPRKQDLHHLNIGENLFKAKNPRTFRDFVVNIVAMQITFLAKSSGFRT